MVAGIRLRCSTSDSIDAVREATLRLIVIFLIAATATPGLADCPPAPDRAADLDALIEKAREAPDEPTGRALSDRMWQIWTDAPDEAAQALLDEGMAARETYNFLGAKDAFDRLIRYCPHYSEGYNQRAFIFFLNGEMEQALEDLDRTLEITPRHVGALSGRALTLMALGRNEEGQEALREALDLNPWIPERGLLIEPPGDDI